MGEPDAIVRTDRMAPVLVELEPMTGIEPAYSAWEAFSTPERVSEKAEVGAPPGCRKVAI